MQKNFCIYGEPPVSNADFIFLQFCIYKLKNNGCAAIIMPDSLYLEVEKNKKYVNHLLRKGIFPPLFFTERYF